MKSQGICWKTHHKCKHPWTSSKQETPMGFKWDQRQTGVQIKSGIHGNLLKSKVSKVTCFPCDCLGLSTCSLSPFLSLCVSLCLHVSQSPFLLPSLPPSLPPFFFDSLSPPLNYIFLCCSLPGSGILVNMNSRVTRTQHPL